MSTEHTNMVIKAREFARRAHAGQTRRDGKEYFTHVNAVATNLSDEYLQIVPERAQKIWIALKDHLIAAAYLHDVLEDTKTTEEDLLSNGFSVLTVDIVNTLTRRPNENYFDFIMRIAESGFGAAVVKIFDLQHNMSDNAKEGSLLDKYRFAHYTLLKIIK